MAGMVETQAEGADGANGGQSSRMPLNGPLGGTPKELFTWCKRLPGFSVLSVGEPLACTSPLALP